MMILSVCNFITLGTGLLRKIICSLNSGIFRILKLSKLNLNPNSSDCEARNDFLGTDCQKSIFHFLRGRLGRWTGREKLFTYIKNNFLAEKLPKNVSYGT